MTDRIALLEHEEVLDGKVALGSSGPRTAALLARCAFEAQLMSRALRGPRTIRLLPPGRNSSCSRSWGIGMWVPRPGGPGRR